VIIFADDSSVSDKLRRVVRQADDDIHPEGKQQLLSKKGCAS